MPHSQFTLSLASWRRSALSTNNRAKYAVLSTVRRKFEDKSSEGFACGVRMNHMKVEILPDTPDHRKRVKRESQFLNDNAIATFRLPRMRISGTAHNADRTRGARRPALPSPLRHWAEQRGRGTGYPSGDMARSFPSTPPHPPPAFRDDAARRAHELHPWRVRVPYMSRRRVRMGMRREGGREEGGVPPSVTRACVPRARRGTSSCVAAWTRDGVSECGYDAAHTHPLFPSTARPPRRAAKLGGVFVSSTCPDAEYEWERGEVKGGREAGDVGSEDRAAARGRRARTSLRQRRRGRAALGGKSVARTCPGHVELGYGRERGEARVVLRAAGPRRACVHEAGSPSADMTQRVPILSHSRGARRYEGKRGGGEEEDVKASGCIDERGACRSEDEESAASVRWARYPSYLHYISYPSLVRAGGPERYQGGEEQMRRRWGGCRGRGGLLHEDGVRSVCVVRVGEEYPSRMWNAALPYLEPVVVRGKEQERDVDAGRTPRNGQRARRCGSIADLVSASSPPPPLHFDLLLIRRARRGDEPLSSSEDDGGADEEVRRATTGRSTPKIGWVCSETAESGRARGGWRAGEVAGICSCSSHRSPDSGLATSLRLAVRAQARQRASESHDIRAGCGRRLRGFVLNVHPVTSLPAVTVGLNAGAPACMGGAWSGETVDEGNGGGKGRSWQSEGQRRRTGQDCVPFWACVHEAEVKKQSVQDRRRD
ncbi:hypothetical protein C8R44DRAFT_751340 [Mycena epipterygia]|nr:hypothetical protein C8R44DRAFT_751340 [Mycena epipterygia]